MSVIVLGGCRQRWSERECDGYNIITQSGGATLGYSPSSGVRILTVDGFAFKDLSGSGRLEPYEDWRIPIDERVEDLASRLSIEQIAGLMLYSNHQAIPATTYDVSPYGGEPYADSGAEPWRVSDHQRRFLEEDNLRHILVTTVESPEAAARWNNEVQALVEGLGWGIPANNSSDPRHSARADAEFNAGGGGKISMWPGPLGLAATFSPELVERFGRIASLEYRAMGFATALSPQVDIATDPRWYRCCGTFGEDPYLAADLARAYCDGFQTSEGEAEIEGGWGYESVNAMVKHWPGGGSGEAGRDAHYGRGKYAVYPNGNMALHKIPFIEGAFRLDGKTSVASAVMPYYTISTALCGEQVGNGFSREIIGEQLREQLGYDGVVCTDWLITHDYGHPNVHSGKPWGVEHLTEAERHYKALLAGVDQFGGNNDKAPVLEAFEMMKRDMGEDAAVERFRASARRLLRNIFRAGLFENPYIDPAATAATVGCAGFMAEGYEAQLRSAVMLKNRGGILPVSGRKKVYIPSRVVPEHRNFWGGTVPEQRIIPVGDELIARYFEPVATPEEADLAVVFISSPDSGAGYSMEDRERGGNGYVPISLQYEDYTADFAREHSLAGGDPYEDFTDRSYRGKSVGTINRDDMELVRRTRQAMGDKPVVVSVNLSNPMVMSEVEPEADALFVTFDTQNQVILDLVTGHAEPSGLLPMQMPADMRTVEENAEDTPRDMRCHVDTEGNRYDFAFGLDWNGVIDDDRVKKYR